MKPVRENNSVRLGRRLRGEGDPPDVPDMSFEQMVDWASNYLLQELLAGRFRSGVHLVLSKAAERSRKNTGTTIRRIGVRPD